MIGIRRGAVTHKLRDRRGSTRKRVLKAFENEDAGALPHDEPIAGGIEGTRGLRRLVVEACRQSPRRGEAAERDGLDGGFRTAAHGNVGFARPDEARTVAERLNAGRASGDGGAQRPPEPMPYRDLSGGEVRKERGNRERREAPDAQRVGGPDRAHDVGKAADPAGDDRGGPPPVVIVGRDPASLPDRFIGGSQGEENETVHLLPVF